MTIPGPCILKGGGGNNVTTVHLLARTLKNIT